MVVELMQLQDSARAEGGAKGERADEYRAKIAELQVSDKFMWWPDATRDLAPRCLGVPSFSHLLLFPSRPRVSP